MFFCFFFFSPEVNDTKRLSCYPDNTTQNGSVTSINLDNSTQQNHHRASCVFQNTQNGNLPNGEQILEVLDEPVDEPVSTTRLI